MIPAVSPAATVEAWKKVLAADETAADAAKSPRPFHTRLAKNSSTNDANPARGLSDAIAVRYVDVLHLKFFRRAIWPDRINDL